MNYTGVIIEESLENKDILQDVKIIETKVEKVTKAHHTPWVTQWTLHTVEIPENIAQKIAEKLSTSLDSNHTWYADFKTDSHHYIIFRNKVFFIDRHSKTQYDKAKHYGISLGIPDYQVDFHPQPKKLCSACLLGVCCRYDGKSKPNKKVLALAKKETLIPICPEQLGGLPTPRAAAEQKGGRVVTKEGTDVTDQFLQGAQQVLELAKAYGCKEAILKQRSPSCGCGQIFDGTFSGTVTKGDGITTQLLKANGISVKTEEDV